MRMTVETTPQFSGTLATSHHCPLLASTCDATALWRRLLDGTNMTMADAAAEDRAALEWDEKAAAGAAKQADLRRRKAANCRKRAAALRQLARANFARKAEVTV